MVSIFHAKPLGIKQESTRYGVAASEMPIPLCSIIDAVSTLRKEERGKNEDYLLSTFTDLYSAINN